MSDEKKMFAVVEDDVNVRFETNADHAECIRCVCLHQCGDEEAVDAVASINYAVERERREAAVKALRDKAAFIEFDAKATWDRAIEAAAKCKDHLQYHARVARRQGMFDAASILNEEAAKIERGEQ